MNWLVKKSNISGIVEIPPSKSLTIRAIILASLADGTSTISNYLISDDTLAIIEVLRTAGIKIIEREDNLIITGNTFVNNRDIFNCRSSATAFRLIIPILIVKLGTFKITGNDDLISRPFDAYCRFFNKYQISYQLNNSVYEISGNLTSGQYEIDGEISSQYASGLAIALSTLKEASTIIINHVVSRPYLEMTIKMINYFSNHQLKFVGNLISITENLEIKAQNYRVEGDYSQAAFFLVLASLGFDIKIKGLSENSWQGDQYILKILKLFGVATKWENELLVVSESHLMPAHIDFVDNPDLFLITAVLACFINGKSKLYNISNLQFKETNRINSLTKNLDILGIPYLVTDSSITINGGKFYKFKIIDGFNDHRAIMAMTIFALATKSAYIVKNTEFINKSYPNFLRDITNLGGTIEMKTIEELRENIINIDKQMIALFKERSQNVLLISNVKKELKLPIVDKDYEAKQIKIHLDLLGDKTIENQYIEFYSKMLDISYKLQEGVPKLALIGQGLSHSFSPKLHHIIGRLNDFKYDYHLIEVLDENELKESLELIRKHEFKAFNITMPYKRSVIKYLDVLTNKAHFSGVVNLVYMKNGLLIGDNVDYDGVAYSFSEMNLNLSKHPIFILGTGATAKTVASYLDNNVVEYTFVSRTPVQSKEQSNVISYEELKKHNNYILINTTPVGMYPSDEMPIGLEEVRKAVFIFDVIYNPNPTKIVKYARAGLSGLDMLVVQGISTFNQVFDKKVVITKALVDAIKGELSE